jgi:site-specific DNA recombinase
METKLILIARVSDIEQRKALPAQKLRLERYAEQKQLPSEYHEFDESAHKDVRQKFGKLVEHIQKQTGLCYVVFDKIDRFTRDSSQEEVKALQQLVKQGKIELHFPNDSLYIDKNSSAADWFRLGIGMALAKYYSDSIRDNVKRRFEQMLSEGIWVHRAPIGYKNVNNGTDKKPDKNIEVDTTKAHYIVRAFEMRAQGLSYSVIAKDLYKMGFHSNNSRNKAPSKQFLERILSNPFYYGVMVHNEREFPHKYQPLISRALFNQVQRIRSERKHSRTKYDSKDYIFKKIVKCGDCKRAVSPFKSRNSIYLRCANPSCNNPNTPEKLVIEDIKRDIKLIDVPENWLDKVIAELRNRHDDQQTYYVQNITQTRTEYDKIKEKMSKIYYDLLDGRITQTLHDEIATNLRRRQQELNDQLKLLTSDNKEFQVTASYLLDLAQRVEQLFNKSDPALQNKLLEYVLSNIELKDKKLSYTYE